VKFIEIGDQLLFVLGIQNNAANAESDFSIDVVLQYSNFTFAQDNTIAIAKKIMKTYNFNNVSMEYNVYSIRLHASNASVIFSIQGNYTDKSPIFSNNMSMEHNVSSIGLHASNASVILSTQGNYTDKSPIFANNMSIDYNFNNMSMEHNVSSIGLHASNASVILSTQGNYTDKSPIFANNKSIEYNFNNMSMEYNVSSIGLHASNASVILSTQGNYKNNNITIIKYHQEFSIFGLSYLNSIIGLSVSGAFILMVVVIIFIVVIKKQNPFDGTIKNEIVMKQSGYCMVCQGEVPV